MPKNLILLGAIAVTLSACSGGSGSGDGSTQADVAAVPTVTPPATMAISAEGLYTGSTSNGRSFTGLVLDDGSYYVIYSAPGNATLISGAAVGTGISTNGSFSSTNAKDINLEGLGLVSASVSASYTQKKSFNGSIAYPSTNQTITFAGTYNAAYESTPTLTAIAGTYTGRAGSPSGVESGTVTITASGALSGRGSSGCAITGSVEPRAKGNVYNVVTTFGGSPCRLPNATVRGAAYFDATTRRLYSVGLTSARTDGFIYAGSKP